MEKIYLFHNNAKAQPRADFSGYLSKTVDEVMEETLLKNTNGNRNTGTYLMTDTLRDIVDADRLIPRFYEFEKDEHIDTVVTNVLHRIGGNIKVDLPYWENILAHADRVVPLTMGFAFDHGEIAPMDKSLERLLHLIAERTELGVRTEYDAEFLNQYGFKNVYVIGCPSLFYHMDRNFKIDDSNKEMRSVNFNFSSDFGNLGITQKEAVEVHWNLLLWFKWQYERLPIKVNLTMQKPPFGEMIDMHSILLSYGEIHPFYRDCGRYFYSVQDWIDGLQKDDFSMGSRFHGNIAAILAGVPALMVNIDKRMKGMNDYFKIPCIDIHEFDREKSLEYYRERANYSDFNANYTKAYDAFTAYCERNGVRLRKKGDKAGV